MSAYKYFSIFLVSLTLISCASRQTKRSHIELPPPNNSTPIQTDKPQDPYPMSANSEAIPQTENTDRRHSPDIALVIGGSGVASFATVGLLKRLHEEGIHIGLIVTSGQPSLFAVASGFLKSVHDLEWFALRLQKKDLDSVAQKGSRENASAFIESQFKNRDLKETRYPVKISTLEYKSLEEEIYDRGDWFPPLVQTMSVETDNPDDYGKEKVNSWINSIPSLDVNEAKKDGFNIIVAVDMYEDYYRFLKSQKPINQYSLPLVKLRDRIKQQLEIASIKGKIVLGKSPNDLNAKRAAMVAGYKEGARLAKLIRASQK